MWECVTVARCLDLPPERVCVVIRDDHGSDLDPEAEYFVLKFRVKFQDPWPKVPQREPGRVHGEREQPVKHSESESS